MSIFNIQFGTFNDSGSSWFDWLSVFISGISILLAYYIAERVYSKEKKDKKKENADLVRSTNLLLENNLRQLNIAIIEQITSLKIYNEEKNFKLTFHPDVQVDFLQFVNIQYIYEGIGYEKVEQIAELNDLMSNLFRLYDFRVSLRSEVRTYLEKYAFFENKFYTYRKVLYGKYFQLCNARGVDFVVEAGVKKWRFDEGDLFMRRYSTLRNTALTNPDIINESGIHDRKAFSEAFLLPIVNEITFDYIPEDISAIEVNDLANESCTAFTDMESITEKHFSTIESYIQNLERISLRITNYLN